MGGEVLDLFTESTALRDTLEANTKFFRDGMAKLGFTILPGTHPICPVMLGDAALADALLFPIAALDGLLYWFCHLGNQVAIEFAPRSGLFRKETPVLPAAIFMWLVIDTLLIWLAWRAANQPVAGQPIAPP